MQKTENVVLTSHYQLIATQMDLNKVINIIIVLNSGHVNSSRMVNGCKFVK